MKICVAQTKSIKGTIHKNINNHLRIIRVAIDSKADLVVFPELSITNYEPELAAELATDIDDPVFDTFQHLADEHEITIGIGMPTKSVSGIKISMLIFQANRKRTAYSKQLLHSDELPFFTKGNHQTILHIKGQKIAIGICYETLQREHFLNAYQNGIDLYVASVAKSQAGVKKVYAHFPEISSEFGTAILMANCIGSCDNFTSTGQSAIWNNSGVLIGQLDAQNQGVLIYDITSQKVESRYIEESN